MSLPLYPLTSFEGERRDSNYVVQEDSRSVVRGRKGKRYSTKKKTKTNKSSHRKRLQPLRLKWENPK